MQTTDTFTGFGEPTLRFLRALSRDNTRARFESLREAYDQHYVGAARAFVRALAPHVRRFAPELAVEPRVDGSIVRLHRDARFVGDGPPYKDRVEVWLWEGARARATSLFGFTLGLDGARVGAGARRFAGPALAAYRSALVDRGARRDLERLVRAAERAGLVFGPPELAALPRALAEAGVAAGGPAALGRRRSLYGSVGLDADLVRSAELVPRCAAIWRRMLPLHRWLVEHVHCA